MGYKHGIYGEERVTSLVPMTETDSGLVVAFGTAPVHMTDARAVNQPVLVHTYKDAVAAMGYSDDFEQYTLCEVIKSHFVLFNMAPLVLVNVLDPAKHKKSVEKIEVPVTSGTATIDDPVLLETLTVYVSKTDASDVKAGRDYTAAYDSAGRVVITPLAGGLIASAAKIVVSYTALDPSAVKKTDIIGGIDSVTGAAAGLELVEEVYPRFGLVPGIIIAPGWSHDPTVAAVMKAKTTNIDGHFRAICICDAPTDSLKTYTAVGAWKNKNNLIDTSMILTWPLVSLGGTKYHLSTQLAGIMNKTDAAHSGVPYYSPSNKSLQADAAVLADGTEVYLSSASAGYLNGQGVVTALNFSGGWKAWGNRTTAYPSNIDVKDAFIPIRRMFNWVNNTLITSFWSKIDEPTNERLIETVVDSANIWLNSLTAAGALLGGRVEFREDENGKTDLMDGKIKFHVFFTPPSPAREITFLQEYDPNYIATLFA
ncbi:phage tail sheath family protein [Selenomonas artemidis]|jgi:phage tail sheath protein|uniref:phage tail sheath family protein n=1 Tax=Selenomonas artemidis TaxID=671224 RepID=UPI0020596FA3|nr:phage tail sheath family protein [Selenomonas artemidis]DAF35345.1 MAG TPA: tail sheath tube [Caudoviricetes sp.]